MGGRVPHEEHQQDTGTNSNSTLHLHVAEILSAGRNKIFENRAQLKSKLLGMIFFFFNSGKSQVLVCIHNVQLFIHAHAHTHMECKNLTGTGVQLVRFATYSAEIFVYRLQHLLVLQGADVSTGVFRKGSS